MLLPGIRTTSSHPARSTPRWIQRMVAGSSPTWPSTQPMPFAAVPAAEEVEDDAGGEDAEEADRRSTAADR